MSLFLGATWAQIASVLLYCISVVPFMDLSVVESFGPLQRITMNRLLGKKRYPLNEMNARLFEDEPQCNISPLPKHLFDVGAVP